MEHQATIYSYDEAFKASLDYFAGDELAAAKDFPAILSALRGE